MTPMKLPRRTFLHLATGAAALPVVSRFARAQAYPTRPVRVLVGFAAGGPSDTQARIVADLLSARWGGKSVIVENRPGAGTILATAAVAKAPPDGYTLLLIPAQFVINAAVGQKLPYDPLSDFTPISTIMDNSTVLVANKSFPANSIPELVKEAKQAAAPINFASPGPRGSAHLAGEMLKQRAGIKMQHINYNGSAPALTDVIGGRVPLMFDPWQSSKPYVEGGQLKLIATASADRLRDAPQVPTIGESYPGFVVSTFTFLMGPAGVPEPILQRLSVDVRAIVGSAEFAAKAKQLGVDPKSTSPEELRLIIRTEIEKWTEVAKAANITAE
jgi:tripartite-type tricarboxylate transporter receptor subunit TctC